MISQITKYSESTVSYTTYEEICEELDIIKKGNGNITRIGRRKAKHVKITQSQTLYH